MQGPGQFLWDDGAKVATATCSQQLPDACLGATLEGPREGEERDVLKRVPGWEKQKEAHPEQRGLKEKSQSRNRWLQVKAKVRWR